MKRVEDFQSIFDKDPECGFQLRGDVYMWNMLRAATGNWPGGYEDDVDALQRRIEEMVTTLYRIATGVELSGEGEYCVPFFEKIGYGMSKGNCSREWWISSALPLLKQRARDLVGSTV